MDLCHLVRGHFFSGIYSLSPPANEWHCVSESSLTFRWTLWTAHPAISHFLLSDPNDVDTKAQFLDELRLVKTQNCCVVPDYGEDFGARIGSCYEIVVETAVHISSHFIIYIIKSFRKKWY